MRRTPVLVWEVTTDSGTLRKFRTFAEAERFARRLVGDSASERFADTATISGPGEGARVRLDGANRVWTDMGWAP